jgi:hypothetical protein
VGSALTPDACLATTGGRPPVSSLSCRRAGLPLALGILVYVAVLFAPPLLGDGDTYWHIASGDWMIAHLAVPHADPFSYTMRGRPWTAHEWLAELAMALVFRGAGWAGVVMLFAGAAALAAALMLHHLGRFLDRAPALLLTLLAAGTVAPSLLARPHLLALPVMEIWTAWLMIARSEARAPPAAMVPLMVLWANLHGSFMAGLVLAALVAVEAVVEDPRTVRTWARFMAGITFASLLTPNGAQGFLFPFLLMRMKAADFIREWHSLDLTQMPPLLLIVLCALYMGLVRGLRLPAVRLLILAGLIHSALDHARNEMLAGVIGLLAVAEPLGRHLRRAGAVETVDAPASRNVAFRSALVCIAVTATMLRLQIPPAREDAPTSPISALAHVPATLASRPVFNEYGMGGYLVFAGVRPFIDGRADLYGDPFVLRYEQVVSPDSDALAETLGQYRVEWTILDPTNPAIALLDRLPGWSRLYADGVAVVHVRTGQTPPALSDAGWQAGSRS